MRIVLDTNVLVSSLIAPGHPPALLIDAWLERAFEILISRPQLDEDLLDPPAPAVDNLPPVLKKN